MSRDDGERGFSPPNQNSKVILLVEDEDRVRKAIREMLSRHGFTVLEADGGAQALEICAQHKDSINLTLIDISMPGMSGLELAVRLKHFVPKAKLLFMSGYVQEALLRDYGVRIVEIPFIQKPFKPDGLMNKLRGLLESAEGITATVRAPRVSSRFRPLVDSPQLSTPRALSLRRRIERLRSETWHVWENFSLARYEFNLLQASYAMLQRQDHCV